MKNIYFLSILILVLFVLILYIYLSFRLKSCFRRVFFHLKKRKYPSSQFNIKNKYNKHDSEGVISVSIFGDLNNKKYTGALLNNKVYLPRNWYLRIYLTPKATDNLISKLVEKDYEVYIMNEPSDGFTGTCWRFLPLYEGKQFLSIDADDIGKNNLFLNYFVPSPQLFDKWNRSKKPFIFFGSTACSTIMAGKWGSKYKYEKLTKELESYDLRKFGSDEIFLKQVIGPLAREKGYIRLIKSMELKLFRSNF